MRKKLLLADDSITIQKVVELTFPSDEFEVVTAGNGRVAVDKAMTFLPDMVLCDVIMPQLDGYQVCEALRASPQLKDVPILLLNGAFEPYDADRASAVGAMGNVSKPFDPPALVARVKAILSERASAAVESLAPPASLQAGSEQEITDHEIVEPGTPLGDIADDEIAAHEVTEMEGAEAEHAPYPAAPEAAYEEPGYEEPAYDEAKTMDIALPEAHPAYDDSETHPVSTVEVPIGIRELAARSLVLDAPVFGQAEADEIASPDGQAAADVLTADEPSDFSETLHGPLDLEAPATEAEQTGEFDTAALGHAEVLETMAEAEGAASAELTASDVGEIEAPQGHPGVAEFEFDAHTATTEAHAPDTLPAAESWAPAGTREFSGEHELAPHAIEPDDVEAQAPEAPEPADQPPVEAAEPEPIVEPKPAATEPGPSEPAGFANLAPPPWPPPPLAAQAPASLGSAEVSVPVDMVQQIAQRVISQVSERVIREIAWDVIPGLAEKLIRAEIERIKARAESEHD